MSEELHAELLDLQCDNLLKEKYAEIGELQFSKCCPGEKYFMLFDSSLRILTTFGNAYVCE